MLMFPMNFSWFYAENQNESLKYSSYVNKSKKNYFILFGMISREKGVFLTISYRNSHDFIRNSS